MSKCARLGAVTFSKTVCLGLSLFTVEFATKSLNPWVDLNILRNYYHSNVGFYTLPLTKVDFFFFLETQFSLLVVYVRTLGSKSQNPGRTCSGRKARILAPVSEKLRKDPLLVFLLSSWW